MTDQALPRSLSAGDVLRIPSYRRLWLGQLVSEAGDGLTNLTLLLLVNHLTGSTAAIAAMAICLAIPPMTIGLFAGAYVDRADRRRIMLASDLLRAIVVLGFVFVGSSESLWLLFVLAFVQSSVGTFFAPARGAVIPKVVPPEGLLAANSVAQATRVVASVAGAGLAGLLIGVAGTFWPAFVLDSLSFLASFVLILGLPAAVGRITSATDGSPVDASTQPGIGASLRMGLSRVAHSRLLSTTILSLAVVMLGLGAVNVLFVPLLVRILEVNPAWFGAGRLRPERLDDPRRRHDRRDRRAHPPDDDHHDRAGRRRRPHRDDRRRDGDLAGPGADVPRRLVRVAAPGGGRDDPPDRRGRRGARAGHVRPECGDVRHDRPVDGLRGHRRRLVGVRRCSSSPAGSWPLAPRSP